MNRAVNTQMKHFASKVFPVIAILAALSLISAAPAAARPAKHTVTSTSTSTAAALPSASTAQQSAAADSDKTLAAMQDEMDRSRQRLELTIAGTSEPARPYFIQYRILDLDVHTIVAEFGGKSVV